METASAINSVVYTLFYYGLIFIAAKALLGMVVGIIFMISRD